MRMLRFIATAALLVALAPRVRAADHVDGPAASADPAADITDVFAWTSANAKKVNLVMDLVRNATTESRFSDSVDYVFHTSSAASFGATPGPEIDIVCTFKNKRGNRQQVRCRVGGKRRKIRIFAGLREDPFFFNLAGFRETARIVTAAAGGLTFDAAGCPAVDAPTSAALVDQLQSAPGGGPAVDSFARFNVLAIVVTVNKRMLTRNGPILAVWASTDRQGDGAQIDRMGRAGVNTAVTNPFFRESVPSEQEHHEMVLDEYNAAAEPAQWAGAFRSEIAANLAILDALDTVCGNQLLAGPSATAGRYDELATVLADDQLYVNTASGTCMQYLAVEANALGITNTDCGGRTPLVDSIDTTYSVLAAGAISGVGDGVPVDGDGVASLTKFPFLDVPN